MEPTRPVIITARGSFVTTGLGFARISPDGRRVAFVQYRSPGSLVGKVAIVDHTGTVKALSDAFAEPTAPRRFVLATAAGPPSRRTRGGPFASI